MGHRAAGLGRGGYHPPKSLPLGGRCPNAHTGADEGELCGVVCASVRVLIVVGRDDLGAPNHVPNQSSFCYVKGRGRRFQNPFLFPCRKKKRFLESKEKGAPVRVEWSQIGIRRPGFTPPLRTSTAHGLRQRNRDRPWSYPHFFRRLRGRASECGGAAWYYHCCDAASFDGHRRRYEVSRRCRWRSNRRLGGYFQ